MRGALDGGKTLFTYLYRKSGEMGTLRVLMRLSEQGGNYLLESH